MLKRLISMIFVSIMIGTLLVSKQVCVECTSEVRQVPTLMSAYENVITHEGDLIIDGSWNFVIENCTYIQRGNIHVTDYAKMKIYNSVFRMDQDYWNRFWFIVDDRGSLEVVNSSIDDPKGFCLHCLGFSKINMSNSNLKGMETWVDEEASVVVGNCSLAGQTDLSGWGRVVVTNSSLDRFKLNFDPIHYRGVIDGLRPGHNEYLFLKHNYAITTGIDYGCDLVLINTTVNHWCLDILLDTELVLANSTLETLWIWYRQADGEIYGLHPGYFEDFGVGNLMLRKTSVADIRIAVLGSASVDLTDAEVGLHLFQGKYTVSLSNSNVSSFMAMFSSGILFFNRSSLACNGIAGTQLYILGDVTHIEWQGDWFSSNVTRNYTIAMRDANNNLLENVELTLFDQDNAAFWKGLSDSLGTVSFNVTFADNNHTDTSMLRTFKEGFYNVTWPISLLSGTPIVISLLEKPLGDINEDRVVDIIDISAVAYSFGCVSSDERWNETCDVNKDAEINIIDITLVAKDYGKEV